MATWIIGGILLLVVGAILWKLARDRKGGKSACGCDCAHCHAACGGRSGQSPGDHPA